MAYFWSISGLLLVYYDHFGLFLVHFWSIICLLFINRQLKRLLGTEEYWVEFSYSSLKCIQKQIHQELLYHENEAALRAPAALQ